MKKGSILLTLILLLSLVACSKKGDSDYLLKEADYSPQLGTDAYIFYEDDQLVGIYLVAKGVFLFDYKGGETLADFSLDMDYNSFSSINPVMTKDKKNIYIEKYLVTSDPEGGNDKVEGTFYLYNIKNKTLNTVDPKKVDFYEVESSWQDHLDMGNMILEDIRFVPGESERAYEFFKNIKK